MSPDSIDTILKSLDRMGDKIDGNGEALHAVRNKLTEIEVIAREARADIRLTNGRVTALEEREAEARGERKEHDRMERKAHEREQERDERSEKWRNIGPNVITGFCSGVAVIAVAFLLDHI